MNLKNQDYIISKIRESKRKLLSGYDIEDIADNLDTVIEEIKLLN